MDLRVRVVRNPNCPFTYFEVDDDGKDIAIGVLYNDDAHSWSLNASRDVASELHKTTLADLHTLYITGSYAGPLIHIAAADVKQAYRVIQSFVDRGARVYANDRTQVTFGKGDVVNQATMLRLKYDTLVRFQQNGHESLLKSTESVPIHRSAFWTLMDGSPYAPGIEFARWYRERCGFEDRFNAEDAFMGEHLEQEQHL